jgi:hypothetical protein
VRPSAALEVLGLEAEPDVKPVADREAFAPALSLAVAGADRALLPLDFRRSRLTPVPKRKFTRGGTYAMIGAAALLLAVIGLYVMVEKRQAEFDALTQELKGMSESVKSARATVDKVNYGRGFFDTRPPYLEVLRELTMTFRNDEQIYVTNLNLRDNRKGTIQGKAARDKIVRDLLDRMKKNPSFGDVRMQEIRETGGKTNEFSFTITFTYPY